MLQRRCHAITDRGDSCRQAPLHGHDYCFWHDPDNATEAAEARRLGGLRRRREHALHEAYGLEGLDGVAGARRLLDLAVTEALSLENTLARSRVLIAAAHAAARLLEVGEFEDRLKALEAAVGPRLLGPYRR
jgi:hypothetical protein